MTKDAAVRFRPMTAKRTMRIAIVLAGVIAAVGQPVVSPKTPVPQVRQEQLSPRVKQLLRSYGGSHLTTSGQERWQMTGTLTRGEGAAAKSSRVVITIEYPARIRIDEVNGPSTRITSLTEQGGGASDGPLGAADDDLLQALLWNSTGNFFVQVQSGAAMRLLGERFKITTPPPGGRQSFHTLVQVVERQDIAAKSKRAGKIYGFNSETGYLELVREESIQGRTRERREVTLTGSRPFGGVVLPTGVEYRVNGNITYALTIDQHSFSAQQEDGFFSIGGAR